MEPHVSLKIRCILEKEITYCARGRRKSITSRFGSDDGAVMYQCLEKNPEEIFIEEKERNRLPLQDRHGHKVS